MLLNGRKIHCISQRFHDKKFITCFREKSEIFKSFFAKQRQFIDHGSTLPSHFPLITDKLLSDFNLSIEDIKKIISKLESIRARHGGMISIHIFKLFDKSICDPFSHKAFCHYNGKCPMLYQSTKKRQAVCQETTDLSILFQFLANF